MDEEIIDDFFLTDRNSHFENYRDVGILNMSPMNFNYLDDFTTDFSMDNTIDAKNAFCKPSFSNDSMDMPYEYNYPSKPESLDSFVLPPPASYTNNSKFFRVKTVDSIKLTAKINEFLESYKDFYFSFDNSSYIVSL